MNKTKLFVLGAIVVLALGYLAFVNRPVSLGSGEVTGQTHYQKEAFLQGFYGGTSRQFELSNTGTVTIGSGGTPINSRKCYTDASFNPASVSSSTAAATDVFLTPNAIAGDSVGGTLTSVTSTSQWFVTAKVTAGSGTATASSTLYLKGLDGAAVDLSTTTAQICITD